MAPISKTFQMKLSSLFSTAKLGQAYKFINRYSVYFSNCTCSLSRQEVFVPQLFRIRFIHNTNITE